MYPSAEVGQERIFDNNKQVAMQPVKPTRAPSHVFLGLILVSGVRPNAWNETQKH